MNGNGLPSYNEDVLSACPGTDDSKKSLIEELKNRAKGCIASRNFPEAIKLYSKGLDVMEGVAGYEPISSILHSNRSMCYTNMNDFEKASSDASDSISLDPTYVKAYYRKAIALIGLTDVESAKEYLQKGLERKPDDKELANQLKKLQNDNAAVPNQTLQAKKEVPKAATTVKTSAGSTVASIKSSTQTNPPAPPISKKEATSQNDDSDDEDITKGIVKGYKKTSDGRTTSYFNNELDEKAKKLIGDIAPKKIENASILKSANTASVGSAWNSAGTYEEKIFTPWASDYLEEILQTIEFKLADPDTGFKLALSIPTSGVTISSGGMAQVTMNRGKKKQMCDFTVETVKYIMVIEGMVNTGGMATLEGTVAIEDITADGDYDVVNFSVTSFEGKKISSASSLPKNVLSLHQKYIKSPSGPLHKCIHDKLMKFCTEFKAK